MKALVYHGPGRKSLDERPMPELAAPTDVIVRGTRPPLCGPPRPNPKGGGARGAAAPPRDGRRVAASPDERASPRRHAALDDSRKSCAKRCSTPPAS